MNVGELIKKVRKEKGMTQKQLANKAEISFSMISKLESGERKNPTNEILTKLANALEVSKAELVDDKEKIFAEWDEKYNSKQLSNDVKRLEKVDELKKIFHELYPNDYDFLIDLFNKLGLMDSDEN